MLCAFFIATNLQATYLLNSDGLLNEKVSLKIEEMGSELFSKTGVSAYAYVSKDIGENDIIDFEKQLSLKLKEPYVLLTLAVENQKVDIISSKEVESLYDKERTLSPFSWDGTIIPILADRKMKDKYNVATLNGYADIVEQIAKSKGIKLKSAIGSTNRSLLHYLRYGVYGFLVFVILGYLYQRRKFRNE
jgi:hypothetical protein